MKERSISLGIAEIKNRKANDRYCLGNPKLDFFENVKGLLLNFPSIRLSCVVSP